jgi:hypothetical protein
MVSTPAARRVPLPHDFGLLPLTGPKVVESGSMFRLADLPVADEFGAEAALLYLDRPFRVARGNRYHLDVFLSPRNTVRPS